MKTGNEATKKTESNNEIELKCKWSEQANGKWTKDMMTLTEIKILASKKSC